MKRILIIAVLTIAASSLAFGQRKDKKTATTGTASSNVEQTLRQLDRDLMDTAVRNDTTLFERIATDDYTSTNPIGMVSTKAQAVAGVKDFKFESLNTDDVMVRVYGDAAILTGRAMVKGQVKTPVNPQQDISGQYRYIRVFVKQQGQWRLAAFQITQIAQPPAQ